MREACDALTDEAPAPRFAGVRLQLSPSDFHFACHVRVRWADTDAVGIAYNGAFLTYFEVARVEYHRAMRAWRTGVAIDDPSVQDALFRDRGVAFTLAASTINWRHPARVDDRLRVATRVERIGERSYDHQYAITRVADGALIALGETTQVRVDPTSLGAIALGDSITSDLRGFESALRTGALRIEPRMS